MRVRLSLFALLILVAATVAGITASSGTPAPTGSSARSAEVEHGADALLAPADVAYARAFGLAGPKVDPGQFFRAAAADAADLPTVGGAWQSLGPNNIGGRVLDIAVDPRTDAAHAGTIYVAAATGGVWKSTDGGEKYTSIWPAQNTQTIGALAIAPDGTLYAGTGEAGPGGGSSTYGGNGVYRSRDDGATWELVGLEETNRIGRIVVDPRDANRVFVAGTGPLYVHGGGRGLYLSEDGGDSWRQVLGADAATKLDNDTTGIVDVAIDPESSQTVYAAAWDNYRERDRRLYEGLGSGLYKSTDGGQHWARIGTPFFGPTPEAGRIGVAVAPDGTVYGNVAGPSGVYRGFFTSTDGGATWTTGTPPANPEESFFTYGWWFGRIYVDPNDSKHVYQAGLVLQESKNAGQTWASAPGGCTSLCDGVHADQHAMAWDPSTPGRIYLGNDGGVYRSDNNGGSWAKAFTSLPISQVTGFDVSEQDPSRIVVGLQDNGQNRSWSKNTAKGPDGGKTFNSYGGGDGQRVLIAPTNKQLVYGCSQYGVCSVSTQGGPGGSSMGFSASAVATTSGAGLGTRWNYFTPIEFDPGDDHTTFTGSELVSVSHDDGATETPISPDLSNGPGRETNPLFKNYGTVTTIGVGRGGTTVYAGTDDGNLWYTHDSSKPAAWVKATATTLPHAWVTRVEVDRTNPDIAYVTYSGYRSGDNAPYILKTADGGVTWTDISTNLPKAPLNDVNIVGDALVVAGDMGVFVRRAGETDWSRLGVGLPLAPAYELRLIRTQNERSMFVATFGRGVYKTDISFLTQ